jgi:hypothetical protein
MSYVVIEILNWTPIFEWYMATFVVKNGLQKTCVMMRLDNVFRI